LCHFGDEGLTESIHPKIEIIMRKPSMKTSDQEVALLVKRLSQRLKRQDATLALAESCTGGWLAKVCTDLPGSSAWFLGGWVVYSNAAKISDGRVSAAVLKRHGAVSEAVVQQLAKNVLERFQSDWSVAVSGIAGPQGGVPGKPVGTVWLAIGQRLSRKPKATQKKSASSAAFECVVNTYLLQLKGSRDQIRRQTLAIALSLLLEK
jgi:nicotinamide-nucleotide amidase